jgi:hypothetical protein
VPPETFGYDAAFKTDITVGDPELFKLQSRTFYVGVKGEEIANYGENYSVGGLFAHHKGGFRSLQPTGHGLRHLRDQP